MSPRIGDLDLSDDPLEPTSEPDLFATARHCVEELKGAEKTVMAHYRAPDYVRWGVEALSEKATGGTLEPAACAVLEVGLSDIRGYKGVDAICKARLKVLPQGDVQMISWFNHFPPVTPLAADTDDSDEYRIHVPADLSKQFGKLARSLGLSKSRLGTYALMAGLLHVPSLTAVRYRKAMVRTLQKLKAEIRRRGDEAKARAESVVPADPDTDQLWTSADLQDPEHDDADAAADDDED